MAITLGSNIASLRTQSRLAKTDLALNKTYEKLSSGLRINTASDDAAGLAIADDLRAKIRIGQVAVRNANDGISTIAIADSALGEVEGVLTRLAELAQQSSTGTFSSTQRSALQSEFTALSSEIERIAVTTEFNGIKILSGSTSITLQVGFDSASTSQITINNVTGTLAALGLAIEVLQMIPTLQRDAQAADWLADCAATAATLLLCGALRWLFSRREA